MRAIPSRPNDARHPTGPNWTPGAPRERVVQPDQGRRRRRLASLGGGCSVLALLLAACGSTSPAAAKTSSSAVGGSAGAPVTQVTLWESHNGGPVGGAMTALVSKFDATHPKVHVSIVVTKASSKLFAAVAAGDPPVLAEISHYDGQLVKGGALVPWNSFFRGSTEVSSSSFVPVAWKNGDVGGQHYRLEADLKLSEVFYNKSLFAKAGITSAPSTWAQLAADAAAVKAKLPGVIPLGWKNSSAHELPAFLSDGGTLLKGGNAVGTAVAFDTPAAKQSFSYFRNLYAAGLMQIHHGTTLREDFGAGKIAMIDGTSAGYQKALLSADGKFAVGAFVEPAGSTGHAANLGQGLGFVLPKGHTRTQDEAAWTFVQWWFAPAQQAYWAEQTGFAPETRAGIAAVPAAFLRTHPGLVATIAAATSPYTVARPVSDRYAEVQAALDTAWFNAVTGRQSVSSALRTLQQQGDSYMSGASSL